MIIGADYNTERPDASPGPEHRYLRQLINGPFDVDKLDYVARDGYFTGLNLAIDVERLLWVLDTLTLPTDKDDRRPRVLCVSASGATVLEQILFSKMQLYSSVYHHHKVRVAHQAILRLLTALKRAHVSLNGYSLADPAAYMCLEDSDVLHACSQTPAGPISEPLNQARMLTKEIKTRTLPMRALVLTHPVWGSDPRSTSDVALQESEDNRVRWNQKMKASGQPEQLAAEIAGKAGVDISEVWIDIPGPAPLETTAEEGLVKFDDETYLPIVKMFPIGGWLEGYQSYRNISYIFARREREKVGHAAKEVLLNGYGIKINDVAFKLAAFV